MAKILKPSVKIVLKKDKTLKNGDHPINLRITFNRKSKYYVLKDETTTMSCSEEKWDSNHGRYKRNSDGNSILNAYQSKAENVLKKMDDSVFTFSGFEQKFFKSNVRVSVVAYFDQVIDELKKENRLGTAASYTDTRNRVKEYVKNKTIQFQDIDLKFVQGFEKFLLANGNKVTSAGVYLRTLKALVNRAIRDGYLEESSYPFKGFTIRKGSTRKRALTKESMNKLKGYKAKKGSRAYHSLNYFLFSYYTRGMNIKDMANLTWKGNIIGDKIVYVRAKTSNTKSDPSPIVMKIKEPIQEILNKYPKRTKYVFPILEDGLKVETKRYRIQGVLKKISTDITDIANELNIPDADDITFYWARHTYATILKRTNKVSVEMISELLGHGDIQTTQVYLDKFEDEELDATFDYLV